MSTLVIINGEEEFLKERAAFDEAEAFLVDKVFSFSLPDDLNKYIEESEVELLLNKSRAFILWNVSKVPDQLPSNSDDVLICVSSPKTKLSDVRSKKVHNFPQLKTFDDKNEVVQWIIKEGRCLNIDLTHVATALFVNSGKSLRKIFSEIEKLAVLAPPDGVVTPEIAKSVMCFSASLTPRSIIDSICRGNSAVALAFYDKMQEKTDETGWVIAYMQRHVSQQIRMEFFKSSGLSFEESSKKMKIHPFVYRKLVSSRLGLWSLQSLSKSLDVLGELDIAHKRGRSHAQFGLELEIIRLSEEAKNAKRSNGYK